MNEALNQWNVQPDPATLDYHTKQWVEPYRSTVHFSRFIADKMQSSLNVLDVGCGGGAPTCYMAGEFPHVKFTGVDSSEVLLNLPLARPKNLSFETDSLSNLKVRFDVDGVTAIQVLHCLPGYELALHQIATRVRPKWIAFSTLVYEGDIDARIVVMEHSRPRQAYHNIYGLPGLVRFMAGERYRMSKFTPFEIDIELEKPVSVDFMGTWTDGKMQRSGPLLMPWAFAMFERE